MLGNGSALLSPADKADEAQAAAEDRKRRAAFSFTEGTGSRYVWMRDKDEEYVVVKVVEERPDGTVMVELSGASRISKVIDKKDVAFPIFRPEALKAHFDDMVKMEDVNEATILHNLCQRFMEDQIYTNIGEPRLMRLASCEASSAARSWTVALGVPARDGRPWGYVAPDNSPLTFCA